MRQKTPAAQKLLFSFVSNSKPPPPPPGQTVRHPTHQNSLFFISRKGQLNNKHQNSQTVQTLPTQQPSGITPPNPTQTLPTTPAPRSTTMQENFAPQPQSTSTDKSPTTAKLPPSSKNTITLEGSPMQTSIPEPQNNNYLTLQNRSGPSSPLIEVCGSNQEQQDSVTAKPERTIEFIKGPSKHPFLESFSDGTQVPDFSPQEIIDWPESQPRDTSEAPTGSAPPLPHHLINQASFQHGLIQTNQGWGRFGPISDFNARSTTGLITPRQGRRYGNRGQQWLPTGSQKTLHER